jgi:hypothetical protein
LDRIIGCIGYSYRYTTKIEEMMERMLAKMDKFPEEMRTAQAWIEANNEKVGVLPGGPAWMPTKPRQKLTMRS